MYSGHRTAQNLFFYLGASMSYREYSDSELVRAYLEGEERAFNELYRRYGVKLQSFIHKRIKDREMAEDLVQEVFLRICRHLEGFDQTKNFSHWMFVIAGNIIKNEYRKRSCDPIVFFQRLLTNIDGSCDERVFNFKDSGPLPDHRIEGFSILEALRRALSQLTDKQRQAFILREVEGMSYEQIARAQGCTLTTLRDRLYSSRINLRRLLAEHNQ